MKTEKARAKLRFLYARELSNEEIRKARAKNAEEEEAYQEAVAKEMESLSE